MVESPIRTVEQVTRLCRERFGVVVDPRHARQMTWPTIPQDPVTPRCLESGGSGFVTYVHSRLVELGYFAPGGTSERRVRLWVVLHLFGDNPPTRSKLREEAGFEEPARSALFTGHLIPRPIDTTAWKVGGFRTT